MEMRTYRVRGSATYLDRAGNVKIIHVTLSTEAPDAETAKTLILAKIDVRAGATADYDPGARWSEAWNVQVEDKTAEDEAIAATGLTVGARVLHKSGGSVKRGADARQGEVQRVYVVRKGGAIVVKAAVDWPAPNRINGDGWHRSDVLAPALILATPEEVERRRSLNRAINQKNEERWQTARAEFDAELAAMGFRQAHGKETHLPEAQHIKVSNGCGVWVLPL